MYPALVNCSTIDYFNEWPQEALLEVGEKYLSNVNLENNDQVIINKSYFCIIYIINLTTVLLNYLQLEKSQLLD